MAVWYEVEKSQAGIKNFLDSNWSFHDFRIEKICIMRCSFIVLSGYSFSIHFNMLSHCIPYIKFDFTPNPTLPVYVSLHSSTAPLLPS